MRWVAGLATAFALGAAAADGGTGGRSATTTPVTRKAVERAIWDATQHLWGRHLPSGAFRDRPTATRPATRPAARPATQPTGARTALCLAALLEAGEHLQDPRLKQSLKYLIALKADSPGEHRCAGPARIGHESDTNWTHHPTGPIQSKMLASSSPLRLRRKR
ncbi:hypothetical protein LCGC14_1323270 [marine sediment metagenome]|uniref:Uncharacterized protein n=1 Tax=marine sediment metagenome TaxID=412755 RepID=A0A0F9KIV4_9ZZZZ